MRGLTHFEHRREKVIPPHAFVQRLGLAVGLWLLLTAGGLVIGMIGYGATEGMGTATPKHSAAARGCLRGA